MSSSSTSQTSKGKTQTTPSSSSASSSTVNPPRRTVFSNTYVEKTSPTSSPKNSPQEDAEYSKVLSNLELEGFPEASYRYDPKLKIEGNENFLTITQKVFAKDTERLEFESYRKGLELYKSYVESLNFLSLEEINKRYIKFLGHPEKYTSHIVERTKRNNPEFAALFIVGRENLPPQAEILRKEEENRKDLIAISKELLITLILEFSKPEQQSLYPAKSIVESSLSKRLLANEKATNNHLESLLIPIHEKYGQLFVRIEKLSTASSEESENSIPSSSSSFESKETKKVQPKKLSKKNVQPFTGEPELLSD